MMNGFLLAFAASTVSPKFTKNSLVQNDFTWAQNASSNSYIASAITAADPGQSYQVQKKTEQAIDPFGNVTQVNRYGFGSLVTPVKTMTHSYLNSSVNNPCV